MNAPLPLVPDDGSEQQPLRLHESADDHIQPYGLAALETSMALLLLIQGVLHNRPFYLQLMSAVLGGVIVYLLLTSIRARLPVLLMTIVAAELGLCYSMPARMFFHVNMLHPVALVHLGTLIVIAGLAGYLLGRLLMVERHPHSVICISFLFMFVFMSLQTLWA